MELKEEFRGKIIELGDESCSWCKSENTSDGIRMCPYKLRAMEATRKAVQGVSHCTSAYCSVKVTCDYYVKDQEKYNSIHMGCCQG